MLRPDDVRAASAFLDRVVVDELIKRSDAALAREVVSLGFSSPWGPAWAGELTADLSELRDFFAAAAAAGDAMVKFESA
ncbi:DUF1877 family protein [Kitasatospora sp. NPDC096204]|uniref:DUF1877 family protein n=1 Tax=Kitasatospora sp. NPDC096204 TaxID=3364094 RepID=UPI00380E8210